MRHLSFVAGGAFTLALGAASAQEPPPAPGATPAPGAGATPTPATPPVPPALALEVQVARDLAYLTGDDAHPRKHRLDVYRPVREPATSPRDPVLLFIHGGAWVSGDKDLPGPLYESMGRGFASRGIVTVIANYRLSPSVQHPAHVQDVARAVAWVRAHIAGHGGDPGRLVLSGHSAGAHLVALLAVDPQYLRAVGCEPSAIRGVAAFSGAYLIRAESNRWADLPAVFGRDPEVRRAASPLTHVRGGHPPFLVAWGDDDFPGLPAQSRLLAEALTRGGAAPERLECADRTHFTLVSRLGEAGDAATEALVKFIARVAPPPASRAGAPPAGAPPAGG